MHDIEPFYSWRDLYIAANDKLSVFHNTQHSEFSFTHTVYNYYIHPQWDFFGSSTLYCKLIYCDYERQFCIIEFIGEWNDAINNDIMTLKRNVIDVMLEQGIVHYILITENVLNFHSSDREYYKEWHEQVMEEEGSLVVINMPTATQHDFVQTKIDKYVKLLQIPNWRMYKPHHLFELIIKNQEAYRLM